MSNIEDERECSETETKELLNLPIYNQPPVRKEQEEMKNEQ